MKNISISKISTLILIFVFAFSVNSFALNHKEEDPIVVAQYRLAIMEKEEDPIVVAQYRFALMEKEEDPIVVAQ